MSTKPGQLHSQLRRDEVTLADLFRSAGYRTGIFGKWHLGDNYPYRPMDRGFDESLVLGGGAIGNTPDYWGNDYFDDTYRRNGAWERVEGYCTDVFFDEAMGFMEHAGEEPFFAYLATNTPHWPHIAPERFNAPYRDRVPERMATFYGMIASIDENVGRLTRFLDRTGLARDTLVVFLTDNGTSFGWDEDDEAGVVGFNAGMRGRKGSVWEGGHRVPFFLRWPGGGIGGAGAGREVDALSAHVDVLPTLAELCALPVPDGLELDGTSLTPLLGGADAPWDPRTLVVDNQRVDHPIRWKDCAVMDGRWRLVNGAALYDIAVDRAQTADVAAAHPATVARLRDAYEAWWDATSARFDEHTRVPLGTPHEDPVVLTSHDVHGQVAWDQVHVRRNTPCDGFWAVDVARPGRYRIRIRRWPEESGLALLDTPEGAEPMRPTHGRLKVGGFDGTRPVEAGARSVDFEVELPAGPTRLQAWLVDGRENGRVNSAFYVEVGRR